MIGLVMNNPSKSKRHKIYTFLHLLRQYRTQPSNGRNQTQSYFIKPKVSHRRGTLRHIFYVTFGRKTKLCHDFIVVNTWKVWVARLCTFTLPYFIEGHVYIYEWNIYFEKPEIIVFRPGQYGSFKDSLRNKQERKEIQFL